MEDLNQALLLLFRTEIGLSGVSGLELLSGGGAGRGRGFVYHVFCHLYMPPQDILAKRSLVQTCLQLFDCSRLGFIQTSFPFSLNLALGLL